MEVPKIPGNGSGPPAVFSLPCGRFLSICESETLPPEREPSEGVNKMSGRPKSRAPIATSELDRGGELRRRRDQPDRLEQLFAEQQDTERRCRRDTRGRASKLLAAWLESAWHPDFFGTISRTTGSTVVQC